MSTLDTQDTQEIGYRAETTDGESLITLGDPLSYQFGFYTTSWGKFPQYTYDLLTRYRGATFDPYEIRLAKATVQGSVSFIPGNAQMIYHAVANSSAGVSRVDHSGGNFTYTITPVQNVKPQPFTYKYFTKNSDVAVHRKQVTGCRVSQLSYTFDFGLQDAVLHSNMDYMGINMGDNLDTNDVVPVYADGNTLKEQEHYGFNDSMECVWDNGGDDVDLIPYLLDFNLITNIVHRFRTVQGLLYPKWIGVGNRAFVAAFRLIRADETSVFDDYLGQVGNTFKDMRFKIFKNDTDYLEFTMGNVAMSKCDMNNTIDGEKQEPFYDVEAVVTSMEFKSRESTPEALYGL